MDIQCERCGKLLREEGKFDGTFRREPCPTNCPEKNNEESVKHSSLAEVFPDMPVPSRKIGMFGQ